MNLGKWGVEGPLADAYSRVTNPGRFQPLHRSALAHLDRLQESFDVERVEGYDLDPELERVELARPSVRLTPADPGAAPIVVLFTAFPALIVRSGRWLVSFFPVCGCDACDETAEGEEERLTELIDNVVSGRFHESIRIPFLGSARHESELGSAGPGPRAWEQISRSRARELVGTGSRSYDWKPWPRRSTKPAPRDR
jgi:hypothetical protein